MCIQGNSRRKQYIALSAIDSTNAETSASSPIDVPVSVLKPTSAEHESPSKIPPVRMEIAVTVLKKSPIKRSDDAQVEGTPLKRLKFVQHNYHDHSSDNIDDYLDAPALPKGGVSVPFPMKLYDMLNTIATKETELASIVTWQPHGRCFVVRRPKEFAESVLPRFFEQRKYASFQRQLNLYGFKRLSAGADRGSYYHERLLRDRRFLCLGIKRFKLKGKGGRVASNPDQEPNFYAMPMTRIGPKPSKKLFMATEESKPELEPLSPKSLVSTVAEQAIATALSCDGSTAPTMRSAIPSKGLMRDGHFSSGIPFAIQGPDQRITEKEIPRPNPSPPLIVSSAVPMPVPLLPRSQVQSRKIGDVAYVDQISRTSITTAPATVTPIPLHPQNIKREEVDDMSFIFDDMPFYTVHDSGSDNSLSSKSNQHSSPAMTRNMSSDRSNSSFDLDSFADDEFCNKMEFFSSYGNTNQLTDDVLGSILDEIVTPTATITTATRAV